MAENFPKTEVAILAGGCFWCLEAVYLGAEGVHSVTSGYIGGHVDAPTYERICDGDTGHAEAVRIEFDPAVIGFADLLDIFFAIHDPTTPNRQGNDVGTQYRSAIFATTPEQEAPGPADGGRAGARRGFSAPPSSPRSSPRPTFGRRSRITTITSAAMGTSPIASMWWRPRWPSSAASSPSV
jgi:peptide-methionine (S)-S-oxide reductase